jgi:hypothetical protein
MRLRRSRYLPVQEQGKKRLTTGADRRFGRLSSDGFKIMATWPGSTVVNSPNDRDGRLSTLEGANPAMILKPASQSGHRGQTGGPAQTPGISALAFDLAR